MIDDISADKRAAQQTIDEWLQEYETGIPVLPGSLSKEGSTLHRIPRLRYESHRTTKEGRLVLAFTDIDTAEEVVAFFNIDIKKKVISKRRRQPMIQFVPNVPHHRDYGVFIERDSSLGKIGEGIVISNI